MKRMVTMTGPQEKVYKEMKKKTCVCRLDGKQLTSDYGATNETS